nr:MAG TPA: hypothetical protein [Caudoviricetes sp.]
MKEKIKKNKSPPPQHPQHPPPNQRLRKAQRGPARPITTNPTNIMKQSIMIDGIEIQYSIETKDIFSVLGSAYIYRPVTFLDTIRIIYRGLQRNCGYSFDEFQAAVMKGNIYPSKKRGHYPLSVATLRIRNRVKSINKQFLQSRTPR